MKKIINEPLNEKLKFLSGVDCWHTYSNDNIKALRTAQKAGFAITKTSAKPLAHYLFKHLTRRY